MSYYNMTDSTGASGFLPTVTFTSSDATFTSVERIAQLSTIGITGLYEADFAGNITVIDVSAFAFDTKVVVATINGVRSIRSDAFYGCSALRAITLDCSVNASKKYLLTDISSGAFQGCTSLRNLHIPDTVQVIPDYMCYDCTSLEVAVMGYGWDRAADSYNRNATIGQYAFANCSRLSYFVIPETVKNVYDYAFFNDPSLSYVSILGRPDVSANVFKGTTMNSATAIYTYDMSKNNLTSFATDISSAVPTLATRRVYREFTISGNANSGLSVDYYNFPAAITTAFPAFTTTSWWKAKIASGVTKIEVACFRSHEIGARYPFMIGMSFPSSLATIGYEAFSNWNNSGTYPATNAAAFYFPNALATFDIWSGGTRNSAFDLTNETARNNSTTKQFVFQSGTSTVGLRDATFQFTSALAIIAPNVTSFGANCFNTANKVQLYSFFQKNAYTALTRLDDVTADLGKNAFTWNFNKGIAGYTHYLYIPKQITRMALELFRGITDKIYVTAYHNTISTAGVTSAASGLGFGFLSYNATIGTPNTRFTGTAPTIHLIYNYVDAAGLALLGTSAFGNDANFLFHVLYPSGVKTIGTRFNVYTFLKSVTIPDTVTDICGNAFSGCTGLTNVFISPTSNLTSVGSSAFLNCSALTSFFIPNSLDGINATTFSGCTSLASVTYGNNPGIKYIGNQAFYGTTKALTSIFIPSSVVFIGNEAFITGDGTNILNTVTFGAGSRLKSIDYRCFGYNSAGVARAAQYLHDIVLPSSLRYMGPTASTVNSPFQNTHMFVHSANFVVPSSVEVIPWGFLFCDNAGVLDISNVYFPRSITNVVGPRVHNGYSVNNATVSSGLAGSEFTTSKSGSLLYLPSELSSYSAANLPGTNRARSYYRTVSFTTNPLLSLNLSGTVANTANAATTTQIHADIKEGVVVIGGGTTSIDMSGSTDGSRNLISVNIPSTVTDICANAFNGCSALAYVTFSENSKLTTIGNSAFLGCTTIHDIQLPDTLTTIGPNAFSGCTNLASISIPYNVTSSGLGALAFARSTVVTKLGQDIDGENVSDQSGYSVAMNSDGTIVAIGAITNISNTTAKGHVRVYKYNGIAWAQLGADIDGEATNDQFGWSVSLSSDGTIVAIGANQNDGNPVGANRGHVRVYKYSGTTWTQLGVDIDGEAADDESGYSVSLSSDGTIVAIGAIKNDGNGANSGHVRVYKYISSAWQKIGQDIDGKVAGDQSGFSVSLSSDGTIVAIGAITNDGNGNDSGHVRVYQYNGSVWTQLGTDIYGEAAGDDSGHSVSLSKDGKIIAIGAKDNSAGQVRVYNYQTITDATWTNYTVNSFTYANKPIVANGGDALPVANKYYWVQLGGDIDGEAALDSAGWSVSLNADGNIVAIGAMQNDGTGDKAGHVRIYQYESAKTTNITDQASNNFGPIGWRRLFSDIDGEAAIDQSGYSVSLSKDGNTVAIGANGNASIRGHVRVYQLSKPCSVRLHQRLYNDISGSLSTYFPGISTSSFQVVPALQLTNTLNPSKLTISQINNMYIRYRQSQLGFCTFVTVSASSGGILQPSDVTSALSGITGFVHLDISTNVTSINGACYGNTQIYSVAISKTVTMIGNSSFSGCTNLTYLSFHPDSVCTTFDTYAFQATNIFDLVLPDSLTTIGELAFASSIRLTSVCIPKSVTSLILDSFDNCTKLTSVVLPAHLAGYGNGIYFNVNGFSGSTTGITFSTYSITSAIPHFKLSDYAIPNGIVQTVIDSAVTYIDHLAYAYYPDITLYAVTTNKQTQTPGQYTYTVNNVQTPIMPAAFWLNGGASNNFVSNSMFPIYRSVPDLNVFTLSSTAGNWPDDQDDYYILMPGYSICIYNNLYDEENLFTQSPTYRYYDNEFGTIPRNITINVANTTSSILIMFNGRILSKYFAS